MEQNDGPYSTVLNMYRKPFYRLAYVLKHTVYLFPHTKFNHIINVSGKLLQFIFHSPLRRCIFIIAYSEFSS